MPTRTIDARAPVDLARTMAPQMAGRGDPTMALAPEDAWVAMRTADGPATLHVAGSGTRLEARAWGPGAEAALDRSSGMVGAGDDPSGFEPTHPLVRRLLRRFPGIRTTRSLAVVDLLVKSVLGQRVTGKEGKGSYRRLATALGEPAPGPRPLMLPPDPEVLGAMASYRFHPFGIERGRAETIIRVARAAGRLTEAAEMDAASARRRMEAVRGVGPWTAALVAATALGDCDAVPLGDHNLPNTVAWVLAGEARATDERMLELLAPFAGHRWRVIRLVKAAGVGAPRFGPRRPLREIRGI